MAVRSHQMSMLIQRVAPSIRSVSPCAENNIFRFRRNIFSGFASCSMSVLRLDSTFSPTFRLNVSNRTTAASRAQKRDQSRKPTGATSSPTDAVYIPNKGNAVTATEHGSEPLLYPCGSTAGTYNGYRRQNNNYLFREIESILEQLSHPRYRALSRCGAPPASALSGHHDVRSSDDYKQKRHISGVVGSDIRARSSSTQHHARIDSPLSGGAWWQPLRAPVIGWCPSRQQTVNVHTSVPLTGVKKLPIADDVFITRQQAKDIIFKLHQNERQILLEELQRMSAGEVQDAGTGSAKARPNNAQLWATFLHNSLPFIGFGFLDNFIMICAGDYIDTTLGLAFGISTMAAAGLGNAISDVAGIGSAWYVERLAFRVGVEAPNLTPEQLDMTSTRVASNFGRAFGVFLGCLIGMCPLLFIDKKDEPVDDSKPRTQNDPNK